MLRTAIFQKIVECCFMIYIYIYSMWLTAGRRFETAVPDDVIMTAGLWDPFAYPIAWKASERSSKHAIHVIKGWLAAAMARGDDLDPGAMQKY